VLKVLKDLIFIAVLLISFLIILDRIIQKKNLVKTRELFRKLRESEESNRVLVEKYEAVVSNIKEVIFQIDHEGKLLYANKSWTELTGFTIDESLGKCILDFIELTEINGLQSNIQSKLFTGELYLTTKDQKEKIVEISMLPLISTDGGMNGYSGSINDVTERKEQERFIQESKQYVEKLNFDLEKRVQEEVRKNRQKDHMLIQQSRLAAMGEMIASIGHQWRQPLNSLSLLIQDVPEAVEFGEINSEYANKFTKESMILIKHMSQTIQDFRKFYLPNKEKAPFSLSESIEDALSIFSISLKNHNIDVRFEYRGQQKAFGNQNEFSQAVLNILTNARDTFVEKRIENRKLYITIKETPMFYSAEILDNGGGIESLLADKIFDPYFTTRPNGTGLGLYMTKMILENMNGSVKVENKGSGACFLLTVPKELPASVQESA
jgi:PAS domain S-box-containing protein